VVKIKNLQIEGLRGVKENLDLPLERNSILLYGDNGSGKSSITDVIEWFFFSKIEHLSTEEIGVKGLEGLRNTALNHNDEGLVKISFDEKILDSKRNIILKNERLEHSYSNNSKEFNEFISESQKENLILRYRDLTTFITKTKKEKLIDLSEIIGFSDVTNTRDSLMKIVNELNRDLNNKDFDNRINNQQSFLIKQLGHNITSDIQFFESINESVKPLKIDEKINNFEDIDNVLEIIKKPQDKEIIGIQQFFKDLVNLSIDLISIFKNLDKSYEEYYNDFQNIRKDIEKINKIILENFLSEGYRILQEKRISKDICPLCLQPKERGVLLKELEKRIEELKEIKKEKEILDEKKESIIRIIDEWFRKLNSIMDNEILKKEKNKDLNKNLIKIKSTFNNYISELEINIFDSQNLKSKDKLVVDKEVFTNVKTYCENQLKDLIEGMKKDIRFETHSKIALSLKSYKDIKELEWEKKSFEKQLNTMRIIHSEFVNKQKEGLLNFLNIMSKDVNDIYQFMHPGEKVEDIKLSIIEKEGQLIGVTIEHKFFDKNVSPPNKYLSESHLNCLGIALFLTSVKAFNDRNRFFILDDVISSFDTIHRKRFADLLIDKFSDYQTIILTHEKNWYEYVKNVVKGKNWQINTIKYSDDKGTYIDEPFENIKERIENRIKKGEETGLGNDLRIYLEHLLKDISFHLKVKMNYQFNDLNEKRMFNELITELKSTLNKRKCMELSEEPVFNRILNSNFVCNISSHDNPIECSMGDYKSVYVDILEIEKLLLCPSCNKYVSKNYYDNVNKNIRCGCGKISYKWIQ